jgi:guanylate kinase
MDDQQKLWLISGPSGAGKGEICGGVRLICPNTVTTISHTTRSPRPGEQDGGHYHFVGESEFRQMVADDAFLEWAQYGTHFYGTHRREVRSGVLTLAEIELNGVRQIKEKLPDTKMIFVLPEDKTHLRERIIARSPLSPEELDLRVRRAQEELVEGPPLADYFVVNPNGPEGLQWAVSRVVSIITAH